MLFISLGTQFTHFVCRFKKIGIPPFSPDFLKSIYGFFKNIICFLKNGKQNVQTVRLDENEQHCHLGQHQF